MLQAPSHLSKVCGHSHIKKFWLTQMQNEGQTCESKGALLPSCSRSVCGSSVKCSDCKRNSACHRVKSILTGVSPAGRPACPVVSGAVTVNGGHGATSTPVRHVSLATCAESLSPTRLLDYSYGSLHSSTPDLPNCYFKEENGRLDVVEETDCSSLKVPFIEDISASSSRCGSPSADLDSRPVVQNVENVRGKGESPKALKVESETYRRDLLSSWEHHDAVGGGNAYSSQEERVLFFKSIDNDSSENHGVERVNSDSGTDAGHSEHARRSPVCGPGTGALDSRGMRLDESAGCRVSKLAMHFSFKRECDKRTRIFGVCADDLSINHRETSAENENMTHNGILRVCSLCGTTKTPLWRSGPRGPKSLCNACGIRFKKSRRFAGHSEGSDTLGSPMGSPGSCRPLFRPPKRKQNTLLPCEDYSPRESGGETVVTEAGFQQQKRSKWPNLAVEKETFGHIDHLAGGNAESCYAWKFFPSSESPCVMKSLSHNGLRREHEGGSRAVSSDEEEAALLLMYLSCGFESTGRLGLYPPALTDHQCSR